MRAAQDLRAPVRVACASACRSCTSRTTARRPTSRAPPRRRSRAARSIRLDGDVVPLTAELRERVVAAERRHVAPGAARAGRGRARACRSSLTDYTPDTRRDRPDLPRPRRHDRPAAARGQRGGRRRRSAAGIRIIMVTGDYGLTAEAIARRIGIVRGDKPVRVITGVDLEDMTDDDLKAELAKPQDVIFARVAPEHKMMVVSRAQGDEADRRRDRRRRQRRAGAQEGRHRRRHGADRHRRRRARRRS